MAKKLGDLNIVASEFIPEGTFLMLNDEGKVAISPDALAAFTKAIDDSILEELLKAPTPKNTVLAEYHFEPANDGSFFVYTSENNGIIPQTQITATGNTSGLIPSNSGMLGGNWSWGQIVQSVPSLPAEADEATKQELLAEEPPRRFSWKLYYDKNGELKLDFNLLGKKVTMEGKELNSFIASMGVLSDKVYEQVNDDE